MASDIRDELGSEPTKMIEEMYPECTDELMKNFDKAYDLWCQKQSDYGDGNIRLGLSIAHKESSLPSTRIENNITLAELGVIIRMNDKMQRLINLYQKKIFSRVRKIHNESIEDSCIDIMNYANMLIVLKAGKWGK